MAVFSDLAVDVLSLIWLMEKRTRRFGIDGLYGVSNHHSHRSSGAVDHVTALLTQGKPCGKPFSKPKGFLAFGVFPSDFLFVLFHIPHTELEEKTERQFEFPP